MTSTSTMSAARVIDVELLRRVMSPAARRVARRIEIFVRCRRLSLNAAAYRAWDLAPKLPMWQIVQARDLAGYRLTQPRPGV